MLWDSLLALFRFYTGSSRAGGVGERVSWHCVELGIRRRRAGAPDGSGRRGGLYLGRLGEAEWSGHTEEKNIQRDMRKVVIGPELS